MTFIRERFNSDWLMYYSIKENCSFNVVKRKLFQNICMKGMWCVRLFIFIFVEILLFIVQFYYQMNLTRILVITILVLKIK